MIRLYSHHLRGTIQSRNLPLYGASIPLWMIPGTVVFAFLATVIWSNS